jgi:hypothetical protein
VYKYITDRHGMLCQRISELTKFITVDMLAPGCDALVAMLFNTSESQNTRGPPSQRFRPSARLQQEDPFTYPLRPIDNSPTLFFSARWHVGRLSFRSHYHGLAK